MAAVERRRQVRGEGKVFASAPEGSRNALLLPGSIYFRFFFPTSSLPRYQYSRVEKCTIVGAGLRDITKDAPLSLSSTTHSRLSRRPLEKMGNRRLAFRYPNPHPTLRGGGFESPALYRVCQQLLLIQPSPADDSTPLLASSSSFRNRTARPRANSVFSPTSSPRKVKKNTHEGTGGKPSEANGQDRDDHQRKTKCW